MSDDRHALPRLGESLAICLEVVGYRMRPDMTVTSLATGLFRTDATGVSKRLNGQTKVTSAQLSHLIRRLGLDVDGIYPEDLLQPPEALREKLREGQAGIYGRAASTRLLRAVMAFEGADCDLRFQRPAKRSSAFTMNPDRAARDHARVFAPREKVHIKSRGPLGLRLLLLDHPADGAQANLLSPRVPGEWLDESPTGTRRFPDPLDEPLELLPVEGARCVTALWAEAPFAEAFDRGLSPLEGRNDLEEFRPLAHHHLDALRAELMKGPDTHIRAATSRNYRVDPQ